MRATKRPRAAEYPAAGSEHGPIGLFRMTDEKGPDEKIICVSARDPFWAKYRELDELDENLRNEIDHFFRVYKELDEQGRYIGVRRSRGSRAGHRGSTRSPGRP